LNRPIARVDRQIVDPLRADLRFFITNFPVKLLLGLRRNNSIRRITITKVDIKVAISLKRTTILAFYSQQTLNQHNTRISISSTDNHNSSLRFHRIIPTKIFTRLYCQALNLRFSRFFQLQTHLKFCLLLILFDKIPNLTSSTHQRTTIRISELNLL